MLNHCHYNDIKDKPGRPIVLSRYAGPGSHRYPLGFSGDTCITWKSLEFQPRFTSSASCAGYGWWSHDIGGHFNGIHSAELQVRWLQLGVFSPIMRLHSSNSLFSSKDPWRLGPELSQIAIKFMRLRHSFIPYIYTMMEEFHRTGAPLIQPLFFTHPHSPESYGCWGEFWFGSELLAFPITSPQDPSTKLGEIKAWIPPGVWHDIFSGMRYDGGRKLTLHRGLETLPVLAKAGAVIPLGLDMGNGAPNPTNMELWVFAGADGSFSLYEDNGANPESLSSVRTRFKLDQSGLSISAPEGDTTLVPENRTYRVKLFGFGEGAASAQEWDEERGVSSISLNVGREPAFVPIKAGAPKPRIAERVYALLQKAEIEYNTKTELYNLAQRCSSRIAFLGELHSMGLAAPLASALTEIAAAEI
jgi:alpha-glucosidase (family GH31 glycosyl hydrolase)